MTIIYRSTDLAKWGAGKGSNLTADEVDNNFWDLYNLIQSVEAATGVGVESATVLNDQLTFRLTDGTSLGPFTLPTIALNPRGLWAKSTSYVVNDVFTAAGSVYLVIYDHTSDADIFDAAANDGNGNEYYRLLFYIPGNTIPAYGNTKDILLKASTTDWDIEWGTLAITNLSDVEVTEGLPIDGQYLKWNNTDGKWQASKPTEIPSLSSSYSGAVAIDRNEGEIFQMFLTGNVTGITVTNWPDSGTFGRLVLEIDNSGGYAINAWPTGTVWPNGVAPTISTGKDIIILMTFNGGTTIYGSVAGKNFS